FSSPASERIFFRLELHDIYNRLHQSAVIKILNTSGNIGIKSYPNPAGEYITLSNVATKDDMIVVKIISSTGRVYYEDRFTIKSGNNKLRVPTSKLPKGQYILSMHKVSTGERQSSNIIKY
ncbi:MAG: T9SS type A sorting domain-containing protein, partial [bacterium]